MPAKVTIDPFGETFEIESGESILQAVLRHGRYVKYGCKHGGCGTCRAVVVSGECRVGDQTSFSLSDSDRSAGIVLMCSTYLDGGDVTVDVGSTMDLTADEFAAGQTIVEVEGVVADIKHLTHDIRLLRLDLPAGTRMDFVPGQYAELQVPDAADTWRSFSMSGVPSDGDQLEFMIRVLPSGLFSTALELFEPGSTVRVRGPFGQFGVRLSHRPIVMVAGGSGMAPIVSILRQLAESDNRRSVIFFFGARSDRDLYLTEWLTDFETSHDWFTFVPALSEAEHNERDWAGERGLITDVLDRVLQGPLRNYDAYLCGPPPMIDAAIRTLTRRGCREQHIHFDRFVPSG